MNLSRIDLDGAGSPDALVTRILALLPDLPLPVPIEALCAALDIVSISDLHTDGFEAALITDAVKSRGAILVANGCSRQRRRFSIAHELGHFLMPSHMPPAGGEFLCSADELRLLPQKQQSRRQQMEVEANRFAALLLMPPAQLEARMREALSPRLEQVIALADAFDVSKDAMARAFTENHDQPVAILVWRDGRLFRSYRSRAMPWISANLGDRAPQSQLRAVATLTTGSTTAPQQAVAHDWFDTRSARRILDLTQQSALRRDGFVMQLIHAEIAG